MSDLRHPVHSSFARGTLRAALGLWCRLELHIFEFAAARSTDVSGGAAVTAMEVISSFSVPAATFKDEPASGPIHTAIGWWQDRTLALSAAQHVFAAAAVEQRTVTLAAYAL
jgi:hypothetical protein